MGVLKEFFDSIRHSLFGGWLRQEQVDGCTTILRACLLLIPEQAAYVLATAYHETAHTMQPIREGLCRTDAGSIRAVTHLHYRGIISTNYAAPDPETGQSYFGRGYVQLTWRRNYERAGRELGLDLVGNPGLALEPKPAAAILVRGMQEGWFTGKKLGDYITAQDADYYNARRIVNGLDKAAKIKGHALDFLTAIRS